MVGLSTLRAHSLCLPCRRFIRSNRWSSKSQFLEFFKIGLLLIKNFRLLKYLTDKIHSRIPHSKIIWYDSMTKEGDIKWQNTLNDMNQEFFKVVDGLFVNYFWKADTPPSAYEYAMNLGRHGSDIFFGNDVWGRGSFASGFETWKARFISTRT